MRIEVVDRGDFAPEIREMNPVRLVSMDLSSEVQQIFENVMNHYMFQLNTPMKRQQIAMEMKELLGRGTVTDITPHTRIDESRVLFQVEIDGVKYTVGVGPTDIT